MAQNYNQKYFTKKVTEDFSRRRLDSLEQNKLHDNFVDLIFNQFLMNGKLLLGTGFKCILLEPLFDIDDYQKGIAKKNFDLLVHNPQTKQTILIEVKSSIYSPKKIIKDTEEAIGILKKEFDDKISPLINLKYNEHDTIEYVLVVPRLQAIPIMNEIISKKKNGIIVWTLSQITEHVLQHDLSNLQQLISEGRTHKNKFLRKLLYSEVKLPLMRTINCLLNSDPCQKLESYVPIIHKFYAKKFNFTDVKSKILDLEIKFKKYCNPENAKKFVFSEIIKNLDEIGLLKTEKETGNLFKNQFSLKINKLWLELRVKKEVRKKFQETYIKKSEKNIVNEALDMYKKSNQQTDMDKYTP